jgi:hypothetical protein
MTRSGQRFRTFQFCPKDARVQCADYGAAISVIDSASNLGAIAMAMSAELPVQTPAADRRKQIDPCKMHGNARPIAF